MFYVCLQGSTLFVSVCVLCVVTGAEQIKIL